MVLKSILKSRILFVLLFIREATAIREVVSVRSSIDILSDNDRRASKSDYIIEMSIKDAYLVFRALCKLSMKQIPAPEG